jgi:hypothetical protein
MITVQDHHVLLAQNPHTQAPMHDQFMQHLSRTIPSFVQPDAQRAGTISARSQTKEG